MQRILTNNNQNNLLSQKERQEVYLLCLSNIDNHETWLTEWFSNLNNQHPSLNEIHRDNFAEWVSWAFFNLQLEDVLKDDALTKELNYMIDHFEEEFHIEFYPGYNEDIIAYRINFDPVNAYHRSLAFYTTLMVFSALFNFVCQFYWNMKKFGPESRSSIWNQFEPNNDLQKVSYWFRDGDRSKKPVVFIHGIGAGLMCYITFIAKLMTSIDAPIFCIELPHVSMNCTEDIPTMQETIRDLQNMLHYHHFNDAVFVSHSLGTAVTSWVVKYMSKNVAGIILLDPVCFMLHYKDVCINFVYRTPKTAAESIVKYFASTELYISYYISRHFYWYQTALFVSPNLPHHHHYYNTTIPLPKNSKIYLSEKDNIVNSDRVDTYLNHHGIDSVVMKGLDHASFLFYPSWQDQIINTINQYICT